MKTIAVIFGGKSVEHDISIITGLQTIKNLSDDVLTIPIYISREGNWFTGEKLKDINFFVNFSEKGLHKCFFTPNSSFLNIKKLKTKKQKIDNVILALHGANGEDGSIQGLLELVGVPYTSSGILGCGLCLDKVLTKMILKQNNIKTPDFCYFYADEFEENPKEILKEIKSFKSSVVIKPARAGSSIGIKKCKTEQEITEAINLAKCFDNKIIVEQAIENFREVNIACLGLENEVKTSVIEEVKGAEILSFDQKYINSQQVERVIDIKLDKNIETEIKDIAKKAFKIFECSGVVRFDFFITEQKEVMLNEINSIPGSLANYLFKDLTFFKMLNSLIKISEQKKQTKDNLTYLYSSKALLNFSKFESKLTK
ncbi:MAG: D-alanine--D-alanine ligase [Clostridia bacterium]|nr:D-alanine--D-alanine ligase [Clostridia bacterium]